MARRTLADYFHAIEKTLTDQAKQVLSEVDIDSEVGHHIQNQSERYMDFDCVDLEPIIDSVSRLEEVFRKEGIEIISHNPTEPPVSFSRIILIRGFVPPHIEIYKETTTFTPASFRPDGYPGTPGWFNKMRRNATK